MRVAKAVRVACSATAAALMVVVMASWRAEDWVASKAGEWAMAGWMEMAAG